MYPKNERERALLDYGYMKGMEEAFERMLIKKDLIMVASEYNKSRIIKIDDRKDK